MAAPRPKKTTVKKKPPVKKKPSFLKKDTPRPARDVKPGDLRSQTLANDNTPRPAKDLNKGGLREQFLKNAKGAATKASKVSGLLKGGGVATAIAAIVDPTFLSGKGEGKLNNDPVTRSLEASSTMSAMNKKMKREIRQGSKLAVTGVKEGTTRRLASTGSRKPAPSANYSGQAKSTYSGYGNFKTPKAKSTYSGYGDFKTPKVQSNSSNTAATTAASGSNGGGSQAANVAKAGGKAKVGRQTRYQRNETAMEQRKRSSSKPKKSIFSLFRKG
jgi:hypothetical protein